VTTFNSANYHDAAPGAAPEPAESINTPVDQNTDPALINTVETSEVLVQGSVSEIVAKSLYGIFPNVKTISEESASSGIRLSVPKLSVPSVTIIALSQEAIRSDPVSSLRAANTPGALLFIDMQGRTASSKEESWFYMNVSNEQYFSLATLTQQVQRLCLP